MLPPTPLQPASSSVHTYLYNPDSSVDVSGALQDNFDDSGDVADPWAYLSLCDLRCINTSYPSKLNPLLSPTRRLRLIVALTLAPAPLGPALFTRWSNR